MILAVVAAAAVFGGPLPNRDLTPGALGSRDVRAVCDPFYVDRHGAISPAARREVAERYHLPVGTRGDYEIIHFIGVEIGGADTVDNLYPVRRNGFTGAASIANTKQHVDEILRTRVCSGDLTLEEAQRREVADWRRAIDF